MSIQTNTHSHKRHRERLRRTYLVRKRQSLADLPKVLLGVSPDLPFSSRGHIRRHQAPPLPNGFVATKEPLVLLARPPSRPVFRPASTAVASHHHHLLGKAGRRQRAVHTAVVAYSRKRTSAERQRASGKEDKRDTSKLGVTCLCLMSQASLRVHVEALLLCRALLFFGPVPVTISD